MVPSDPGQGGGKQTDGAKRRQEEEPVQRNGGRLARLEARRGNNNLGTPVQTREAERRGTIASYHIEGEDRRTALNTATLIL